MITAEDSLRVATEAVDTVLANYQQQYIETLLWAFGILVTAFLAFTIANYFASLHTSGREVKAMEVSLSKQISDDIAKERDALPEQIREQVTEEVQKRLEPLKAGLEQAQRDISMLGSYVFLNQAKVRAERGDLDQAVDAALTHLNLAVTRTPVETGLGSTLENLEGYVTLLLWTDAKPSAEISAKVKRVLDKVPDEYEATTKRILDLLTGAIPPPPKPDEKKN